MCGHARTNKVDGDMHVGFPFHVEKSSILTAAVTGIVTGHKPEARLKIHTQSVCVIHRITVTVGSAEEVKFGYYRSSLLTGVLRIR